MINLNISFAGAGRVASALAVRMADAGYPIDRIVSRDPVNGHALASRCRAEWAADLTFRPGTDLVIVSVPDHGLKEVMDSIRCDESTAVVHTAGSYGLEVFPPEISRRGVFYPLMTFTRERKPDFIDLPFLVEAGNDETADLLFRLAESLGAKPIAFNLEQRKIIHAAAVFICNFTNHMLTVGKHIAGKADIPFGIFVPLLRETISKAIELGPEKSQTGPAVRNDLNTIEKHLELLSSAPEFQEIYKEITESIISYYKRS
jgi:predicted short-subunit dehydrogenase-like oxidoreductase (DUF2520 family)